MRLDDLNVSDEELQDWARCIEKSPSEEFDLEELPFGKQVVRWIDQTVLSFLECGKHEALSYAQSAEVARRAVMLSRLTQDPRPIVAYKIGERWLERLLWEFGCRI
jgi:hypothetical protein